MGPFPHSFGFTYILVLVDYISKWITVATRADDDKTTVKHVKSYILHRYGVPKAIISDRKHIFCNKTLGTLLAVTHKVFTGYHSETNG